MIRVKVEIVPGGNERDVRGIGLLEIENVGGTEEVGQYRARLVTSDNGRFPVDSCGIEAFDRSRGALALVSVALAILTRD